MIKKISIGILIGLIVPILFLGAIYLLFYFNNKKIPEDVWSSGSLFGFGLNALTTWLLFRKGKEYIGRGVMIATFIFFIIWLVKFVL